MKSYQTSNNERRESFMLGALKKLREKMPVLKHYLKLQFALDTTDFTEIEVLSRFCSELYTDKLPISDEIVRLLLRKLRKCQDILRQLREMSAQNKADSVFISGQLNTLSEAVINIKRNATHLKYVSKNVYAIVDVSQNVKSSNEVVSAIETSNGPLIEEETMALEEEETVDPDIYLEAEPMTDEFEIENYNFLEFTPLTSRPETN